MKAAPLAAGTTYRRPRDGFTLLELSIVLVIIGLIIGGVLVGRDLIEASYQRKDMATIEKMNTAVSTFKLKYQALPGDMSNPTVFGFNATSAGNGDGQIQGIIRAYSEYYGGYTSGGTNSEWLDVVHHLATAGLFEMNGNYDTAANSELVAGTYYPLMNSSYGGGLDLSAGHRAGILLSYEGNNRVQGHYFRMGAARYRSSSVLVAFEAGFTPTVAKRFDIKFDDGMPITGAIRIGPMNSQCIDDVYDVTGSCGLGGINAAAWHCALLTTGDYDTTYDRRSCSLRVKTSF